MRRTRSQTKQKKKQVTPSWQDKLQFASVGYRRGAAGTQALTTARRHRHQTARHYFDHVENDEAARSARSSTTSPPDNRYAATPADARRGREAGRRRKALRGVCGSGRVTAINNLNDTRAAFKTARHREPGDGLIPAALSSHLWAAINYTTHAHHCCVFHSGSDNPTSWRVRWLGGRVLFSGNPWPEITCRLQQTPKEAAN